MKKVYISLLTILVIFLLSAPVLASDYVNPPNYETPDPIVDPVVQPTNPNASPNTADGSVLPLAIGIFVVALATIGYVKQKKA